MVACLVISDLICLYISLLIAISIWRQIRIDFSIHAYTSVILPVAICLVIVYSIVGLYPGTGLGPVEELRRLALSTTLVCLGFIALTFYARITTDWSRAIIGLTWSFSVFGMPISRKFFRRLALRFKLWGEPVVVIGDPEDAIKVTKEFRNHPLTGFWPVLCVTTDFISNIFPILASPEQEVWNENILFRDIDILILALGNKQLSATKEVLIDRSHSFRRIICVFDEERLGSVWFTNLNLIEYFGLEVRHQWNSPINRVLKRLLDLTLIMIGLPFLIPLFIVIAVAIYIDDPGAIFYTQMRIGVKGKEFRIWKFRSMISNAEELLDEKLKNNPVLHKEWLDSFKLKDDPRLTRVGKILRSTSLDELPQIWNVLRGEMSVIGPRPIVKEEIPLYGEEFEIFKRTAPGITGLWQISGRNDLSYRERVNLDVYYLQNWSIWLDIHILMHTVLSVLQRRGAY